MAATALLGQVHAHLEDVLKDPTKILDQRLLESIDRQVTGSKVSISLVRLRMLTSYVEGIQESERDALLDQLSALLPSLQQDPTPVTNLIQILIYSSHEYNFSRVLSITPSVDFLAGLTSPSAEVNLTVLALLEKAKYHKSDVGIVAGKLDVVGALVQLWLSTPDTAVAGRAHDVLLTLLLADIQGDSFSEDGRGIVDQGLLWRRIFRDKDIYGSIFTICSLSTAGQEGQLSKRDKTIAQARLLDMLLHIDSEPVRISQLPEIEERYNVKAGGLLHFAAIYMVDFREDVLMYITLLEFYAKYLSAKYSKISKFTDYPLHFLKINELHNRTMDFFLDRDSSDPMELALLYGPSADYLSMYCSTHPEDVLKQEDLVNAVLTRLTKVLQTVTQGQWAQGQVPNHDLHVAASLPRAALIPRSGDSPLFHIPAKTASPNAFNALAHIFHGANDTSTVHGQERAAARALYFLYMDRSPTFWTQVVSAAETVAVKEVALAAISLIGAVITAQWAPVPSKQSSPKTPFDLPTEEELAQSCGVSSLPLSGIATIMSEPAIGIVVPYLMKPAQTFSNLVGGGRGDVESAAYRVAVAKHGALELLHQELKWWVGSHPDARDMVATVGRRIAQGPMGGTSEVGGRIGTMEL